MKHENELEELIDRHLRGELDESDQERLAELLDTNPAARQKFVKNVQWDTEFAEAMREKIHSHSDEKFLSARSSGYSDRQNDSGAAFGDARDARFASKPIFLRSMLAAAALIIAALSAGLIYQVANSNSGTTATATDGTISDVSIARITGLGGSLIWTGDRGQIVRDIVVDTELAGGTIEGMAPDSWFELQFNDGSTVMIAGTSTLTFADTGQKELRLREGIFSADVAPQPAGKPMLIHTPSALLEVLGTQFDVEASLASTSLNVSEGKVRLKRFSDGREVDVAEQHRVFTDGEMTPQLVPDSIHHWKSQIDLGPANAWGNYGKWLPATADQPASVAAIPFVPKENKSVTLNLLAIAVPQADNSPVVVAPHSAFIVGGSIDVDTDVYFGVRVAHPNGEFAGSFLSSKKVVRSGDKGNFEIEYRLEDFALDPSVRESKDELSEKPDNLVLTGVWSFTLKGGATGLKVTDVELIAPEFGAGSK